jgi:hypothetical protein
MQSTQNEALIDFSNAIEAACVKLRMQLNDKTPSSAPGSTPRAWPWDPLKIKWEPKTGDKGPYEKASDHNDQDFQALTNDLTNHQGKLNRDNKFYWLFTSGDIGRKEVKG